MELAEIIMMDILNIRQGLNIVLSEMNLQTGIIFDKSLTIEILKLFTFEQEKKNLNQKNFQIYN